MPARRMVVSLARIQNCLPPCAHAFSQSPRRRSAGRHFPLSRNSPRMARRMLAVHRCHSHSRPDRKAQPCSSAAAPAMGCHLLFRRRTPANRRSWRSASRQIRPRRRHGSSPSHPDHPRSTRRQAQRKGRRRTQSKSSAQRFRCRESARLQIQSGSAASRRSSLSIARARLTGHKPGSAIAGFAVRESQANQSELKRHSSHARSFACQHANHAGHESHVDRACSRRYTR